MANENLNYPLPYINFGVGGNTEVIKFDLVDANNNVFNATGGAVTLSLIDYENPTGTPVLTKTLILEQDLNDIYSIAVYEPTTADTINLSGYYIYQLTLEDVSGDVNIKRGKMYIALNIDKAVLS